MTKKNESGARRLTPFWRKVTEEAADLLISEIKELRRKTVSPEFCLLAQDQRRMERQMQSISGARAVLKTVREGGFWGKAWALDTVLRHKPAFLFN